MADRRVEWTGAARDDLRGIAFYIAQDSLDNALTVIERLERRTEALGTLAGRGRIVPELRRIGERRFRELIEEPWRIIYLIERQSVRVIAVVDSRRDLKEWVLEQAARFRTSKT